MDLRAIRTFVATADAGGLGRASARLHLSQPAASRQIQALEAELGVQLFAREGRSLRLTAEGEDLVRRCRRLLHDADLIADHAHSLKGGQTGILTIAATPHVIARVLAPFLSGHASRHPGVEVQLVEGGAAVQPRRLEAGQVHVAIMPAGNARFDGTLLYPVYAMAVMPDSKELEGRHTMEVAELADRPVLLLRPEFGSRIWFDLACEAENAKPQIRLESAAPQTLIELAAAGYGVAVVPSTVAIDRPALRALPLICRGAALGRWSMAAWDRERVLPQYAQTFVHELVATVRRNCPGEEIVRHAPTLPRPRPPSPPTAPVLGRVAAQSGKRR